MTTEPTPIYDQLKKDRAIASMRRAGEAMGHFADMMRAFGNGFRDGKAAAEGAPSSGSSSQAVSADSAPPHSLQDSGRPEGLMKGTDKRDFEADVYVDGKLVGKAMDLRIEGFLPGCTCDPGLCDCDVDWDAMAEKRLDQGGF